MSAHADSFLIPLDAAAFRLELEAESVRAGRGRCPLSLVLLMLTDSAAPAGIEALLRCLKAASSPCDTLGLLSETLYALILPGVGTFKAQSVTEGILRNMEEAGHACAAGIAGTEGDENASAEKLEREAHAAVRRGGKQPGKAVVYREAPEALSIRKTLVHSHEKRFLFSGGG